MMAYKDAFDTSFIFVHVLPQLITLRSLMMINEDALCNVMDFLVDDYDSFKDIRRCRCVSRDMFKSICLLLKSRHFVKLISDVDLAKFDISRQMSHTPSWVFAGEFCLDSQDWMNRKTTIECLRNLPADMKQYILKKHLIKSFDPVITLKVIHGVKHWKIYSRINLDQFYVNS